MADDDGTTDISVGRAAHGSILNLPCLWDKCKPRICKCCGESSHTPSPLTVGEAVEAPAADERRPWQRYAKDPNHEGYKIPLGSVCGICWRVFARSGLALTHGSLDKYLVHARSNPSDHKGFMKAITAYINAMNESSDGTCAFLKDTLRKALTEVDEERRSGTRMITRRTFVLEKTYLELYAKRRDLKGTFGEKDTCATLDNAVGYWVRGTFGNGLPGHFEFEHYQDESHVLRRHEAGDLELVKNQAENKFQALFQLAQSERQRVEGKMSKLSPAAMLAMIGSCTAEGASAEAVKGESDIEQEDMPSSEDDPEQDFHTRTLFGKKRARSAASGAGAGQKRAKRTVAAASSGGVNAASCSGAGAAPAGGAKGAGAAPPSKTRAEPGAAAVRGVVSTVGDGSDGEDEEAEGSDGRAERLKKNVHADFVALQEKHTQMHKQFMTLNDGSERGTSAEFKNLLKTALQAVSGALASGKSLQGKVERSKNKGLVKDVLGPVQTMMESMRSGQKVLQLLSCKTRTHDKLLEAFAEAEDQQLLLSETMMAIRWESEVQQQLMFLNFDTALQLFIVDTDLDGKVNTLGLPHEDRVQCQSHVLTIIEDFVMRNLDGLKGADLSKPGKVPQLQLLVQLATAFAAVLHKDPDRFLATQLAEDIEAVGAVAAASTCAPTMLEKAVKWWSCTQEDGNVMTPLQVYFRDHDSGKTLLAIASDTLKKKDQELRIATAAVQVNKQIDAAGACIRNNTWSDGAIEKHCAAVCALIQDLDKERAGKTQAKELQRSFHTALKAAWADLFRGRVIVAKQGVIKWFEADCDKARADIFTLPAGTELGGLPTKLKDYLPDNLWKELDDEEFVADGVVSLIQHIGTQLRPTACDEPIARSAIATTLLARSDDVFKTIEKVELDALKKLVPVQPSTPIIPSIGPKDFFIECGVEVEFLDPFGKWVAAERQARLVALGCKVNDLLTKHRGNDGDVWQVLLAVKAELEAAADCPEPVRLPLLAVVSVIEICRAVEQQPGGPVDIKAALARAQKQQNRHDIEAQLANETATLRKQLGEWAEPHSSFPTQMPTLQRAGVSKDNIEFLVRAAETCVVQRVQEDVKTKLESVCDAKSAVERVVNACPEPPEHESKFIKYMQQHASKLGSLHKELEKNIAIFERIAKVGDATKIDPDNLLPAAKESAKVAANLITIFTLVALLRCPGISNPKEGTMRKNLKAVMESIANTTDHPCPKIYIEQVREILSGSDGNAATSAKAPSTEAPPPATAGKKAGKAKAKAVSPAEPTAAPRKRKAG